jgi:hypothetical protein
LVDVVLDDGMRHIEDRLGRPVVLFEQYDLGGWIVLLKLENISDVGLPKAIDTLSVVAEPRRFSAASQSNC